MILSVLGIALAACSDPNALPPSTETNVVDTIDLFSLDGTLVSEPSGFAVELGNPVRTDIFSAFDFVFTVDEQGQPWLLPALALGMPASQLDPGLLPQGSATGGLQFDQITVAPFDGYLITDSLAAAKSLPSTAQHIGRRPSGSRAINILPIASIKAIL